MKGIQILFLVLVIVQPVAARFLATPLVDVVNTSSAIVDATIISGRTVSWSSADGPVTCGIIYEGRVNESLKGSLAGTIRFASSEALAMSSRHVLFLKTYVGDFPTDVIVARSGPEESKHQSCLRELPSLRSDWLHRAEFVDLEFVRLSNWITPPADLESVVITIRNAEINGQSVNLEGFEAWRQGYPQAEALLLPYLLDTNVVEFSRLRIWILNEANLSDR